MIVDEMQKTPLPFHRRKMEDIINRGGGRLVVELFKATPAQIKDEVRRLRDFFGPCWIVSPSHEALLPNVPPQNVAAMAEAAHEEF